ncbi:MAG: laccase domain-containing protein [Actinobacteria bacterium]|nr:laccase domain-containing protein [Actinomycetota bacterium]
MFVAVFEPPRNGGVGIAFTDRLGGVSRGSYGPLNLGRTDTDDPSAVATNFRLVREALGVGRVATLHQVHSADVVIVDDASFPPDRPGGELGASAPGGLSLPLADGMVTRTPGLALCVRVADCVPVLLADSAGGVVGAAHAGRVGLAEGVLEATVAAMRELGADRITAWIGPHVCGRCYEVPGEMADTVTARVPETASTSRWGTPALDLGAGCEAQLARLGVPATHHGGCTLENDLLHSHRRDGAGAGRLGAFIWLARCPPTGVSATASAADTASTLPPTGVSATASAADAGGQVSLGG